MTSYYKVTRVQCQAFMGCANLSVVEFAKVMDFGSTAAVLEFACIGLCLQSEIFNRSRNLQAM